MVIAHAKEATFLYVLNYTNKVFILNYILHYLYISAHVEVNYQKINQKLIKSVIFHYLTVVALQLSSHWYSWLHFIWPNSWYDPKKAKLRRPCSDKPELSWILASYSSVQTRRKRARDRYTHRLDMIDRLQLYRSLAVVRFIGIIDLLMLATEIET